jgi:pullulanase/glycogen debranching enzyme
VEEYHLVKGDMLGINKLAAFALATSQGVMMIHSGQEFARSKVIAPAGIQDPHTGHIDHNSYEKDNETNYLNYNIIAKNKPLFSYYANLIELRKQYPELRKTERKHLKRRYSDNVQMGIGYEIHNPKSNKLFIVLMNGDPVKHAIYKLPEGPWDLMADEAEAGRLNEPLKKGILGQIVLNPRGAALLVKNKQ